MLTKEKFGFTYSDKTFYNYFENESDLGIMGVLSSIGSEDSLLPKFLGYNLNSKTSGWNTVSLFYNYMNIIIFFSLFIYSV